MDPPKDPRLFHALIACRDLLVDLFAAVAYELASEASIVIKARGPAETTRNPLAKDHPRRKCCGDGYGIREIGKADQDLIME